MASSRNEFWNPFTEARSIATMLGTGEAAGKTPAFIYSALRFLSAYEISDYWKSLIETDDCVVEFDHLKDTYDLLIEAGFKDTTASFCLVSILSASIGRRNPDIIGQAGRDRRILYPAVMTMIAGYLGTPNIGLIGWVLSLPSNDDDEDAKSVLQILEQSSAGNSIARWNLISLILPYWKNLVSNWNRQKMDNSTRLLGFPFEYAEHLENHPDFMAWKASVYYVFGEAGDEERARKLVAKAAFLGSREAWALISSWSFESHDIHRVMEAVIAEGLSAQGHMKLPPLDDLDY